MGGAEADGSEGGGSSGAWKLMETARRVRVRIPNWITRRGRGTRAQFRLGKIFYCKIVMMDNNGSINDLVAILPSILKAKGRSLSDGLEIGLVTIARAHNPSGPRRGIYDRSFFCACDVAKAVEGYRSPRRYRALRGLGMVWQVVEYASLLAF